MTKEVMVLEVKGEAVANSREISNRFEKQHQHVTQAIENLISENSLVKNMFHESKYISARGRMYKQYDMTRDGFSLLVMGFTGKEALEWKLQYIDAFNKMESFIREKESENWKQARLDGKIYRRTFTDAVQLFVSYCEENGSKSAHRYYANFTKMLNSLVGCENRENANGLQLQQLSFLESILAQVIALNIAQNTEYHEIYTQCKVKAQSIISVASVQLLKE